MAADDDMGLPATDVLGKVFSLDLLEPNPQAPQNGAPLAPALYRKQHFDNRGHAH